MEQQTRCCPKCGSRDYVFRGRKHLPAAEGEAAAVQTKYLCRPCGHGWKERVPSQTAA